MPAARPAGPSFPPLAEALGLGSSRYSPWLVEGAVRLGSDQAFAPAAAVLAHFTGVTMSPATVRRLTLAAGATIRQLDLAVTDALWSGTRVAQPAGPVVPLQLSIDGSMVHVRDEGWREVKVLAIGERTDTGLRAQSYAATLGDAARFGQEILGEVVRREVSWATDVVAVNDGADWIQGCLDLHCPQAHRVLDFAHAAEYLATAAAASFGEGTSEATDWFTTWRHELRDGDPDTVLAALGQLPAGDERDTARGYLTTRRAQIAYADFLAQGWPIGSGCVESAHKEVVQARCKGRGMRWTRSSVDGMLALQVTRLNDRWTAAWPQVAPQQRVAQRQQVTARRATRRRPPPVSPPGPLPDPPAALRPKRVVDGKPTPDHVWRRFRLPGSLPPHHES